MSMPLDTKAVAQELIEAYSTGELLGTPLSAREGFDLAAAYAVGAELTRQRRASGHTTVGRKVAFANPAVWQTLKIETVAWAPMYDDTVQQAKAEALCALPFTYAPKLEPEIVFKLNASVEGDPTDPVAVLNAVEWLALGYEIVDCPFPEWQFQPADLVAAYGFHAGLVLGASTPVTSANIATLATQLAQFTLKLFKNDTLVEEGGGRNVLRSPALCLGELAAAIRRSSWAEPLMPGELVSTGSLTTPTLISPGDAWRAEPEELDVAPLVMKL